MRELATVDEFDRYLAASGERVFFVFKHSTSCPVSAAAFGRVRSFEEDADTSYPEILLLKVIECRSVSDHVANKLGVKHESPQLILVRNGVSVWEASHGGIGAESMKESLGVS